MDNITIQQKKQNLIVSEKEIRKTRGLEDINEKDLEQLQQSLFELSVITFNIFNNEKP